MTSGTPRRGPWPTPRDRIRRDHPGLQVETALLSGDPVDALVAAAQGQELLVLGSRGLGGFAGLLVGSVGLAVTARADAPVVLVRAGEATGAAGLADGQAVREVVVGLDARHPADALLDFAFSEAAMRNARLRAVHAWILMPAWSYSGWVPPELGATEREAAEAALLTQALASWRDKYPGTEVVEDIRLGGPAKTLLDASADADLVVVGRRDRHHDIGMRLGPVAHAVIHHATAPVAVIPHP